MEEYKEVTVHERARDEYIIDTDFHLHLPTEALFEYVERGVVRSKLEKHGPPPNGGLTHSISTSYGKQRTTSETHDRIHGTAVNPGEIKGVMDELAIDAAVVEPGTNIELMWSNYPSVSNALVRAYNDYLVDRVIDVDKGIYASLLVPEWDVGLAVEELERLGDEDGFVAAQNWMTSYKLWGDPDYDPIFEKLVELDLPLFLHIASQEEHGPAIIRESMRTGTEKNVAGYGYSQIANAINLVMTGVFDKFPSLNVVFHEAGTLWLPYVAYRADEEYQTLSEDVALTERMRELDQRYLQRLPSEYIFDNIYVGTQPIAFPNIPKMSHVEGLLKAMRAEDTLIYSSDWPHLSLDPADWVFNIPAISDEMRRKILSGNAEEVLRMPN